MRFVSACTLPHLGQLLQRRHAGLSAMKSLPCRMTWMPSGARSLGIEALTISLSDGSPGFPARCARAWPAGSASRTRSRGRARWRRRHELAAAGNRAATWPLMCPWLRPMTAKRMRGGLAGAGAGVAPPRHAAAATATRRLPRRRPTMTGTGGGRCEGCTCAPGASRVSYPLTALRERRALPAPCITRASASYRPAVSRPPSTLHGCQPPAAMSVLQAPLMRALLPPFALCALTAGRALAVVGFTRALARGSRRTPAPVRGRARHPQLRRARRRRRARLRHRRGHRFVRRIPTMTVPAGQEPENVKGIAASAKTGRSTSAPSSACSRFDLRDRRSSLWNRTYEGGCDRLALSPDGRVLYVPSLEGPHWHVHRRADGRPHRAHRDRLRRAQHGVRPGRPRGRTWPGCKSPLARRSRTRARTP